MQSIVARDLDDWVTGSAVSQSAVRMALTAPVLERNAGTRLSSRLLGWRGLSFEQHEFEAGTGAPPGAAGRHLVILGLGQGRIVRNDAQAPVEIEVRSGGVAFCPAAQASRWSAHTRLRCCVLALDPVLLDRTAADVYGAAPGDFELVPMRRDYDFGIVGLSGALAEETMRGVPGNNLYVNSLANILAVHLLRHYAKWHRHGPKAELRTAFERTLNAPEPVRRAIVYIRDNHTRGVGLREIAAAACVSPYHLARLFKETMGVPPYQYLIQLRVQSAQALLAAGAGMHSLAEVALAVGFSDQSHLTRHFKRVLGMTPMEAMNKVKGKR